MLSRKNLNEIMENLSSYGDILAIPFFLLLTIYFYNIEKRSITENILLLFSIVGLVADILFTILFFT
tara:strand:- start:860 stop:1060 length:201 start_codon:yes stop_codon:yes gene_type:complete